MNYQEIAEDLSFLESWEDRLEYVIDLGKSLPPLAENEMSEEYRVKGCASQVWLVPESEGDELRFRGGSDALIVQGLIAVLLARVNGQTAKEISHMELLSDFEALGLAAHLTSQRSNGLRSMIDRIETIARMQA